MRGNRRLTLATLTAALAFGAVNSAATAADVTLDLVVSADTGGLTMSTAAAASDLTATFSTSAQTVEGAMPSITVTDVSGDLITGWSLSVDATSFDNSGPANTDAVVFFDVVDTAALITASTLSATMSVTSCACYATGTAALIAKNLGTTYELAGGVALAVGGVDPTVTFTPKMHAALAADLAADTYSTTVTYTFT